MPTLFIFFGLRFFFWSREHEPIHVHVERDGKVAKFDIAPQVVMIENNGLKQRDLATAKALIEENKEEIIRRWNEYFKEL